MTPSLFPVGSGTARQIELAGVSRTIIVVRGGHSAPRTPPPEGADPVRVTHPPDFRARQPDVASPTTAMTAVDVTITFPGNRESNQGYTGASNQAQLAPLPGM